MSAVAIYDSLPVDDPSAFVEVEVPTPQLRERDLLVRVTAVSVNPIDWKVRQRSGPQETPKILGFDAVGIVEHTGAAARRFRRGDRVFYAGVIDRAGTNAQFHAVDERIVARAPETLDDGDAAALPLVSITAWNILFSRLGITDTDRGRLLALGGAGGVATQIIQLARALTGVEVIATASREESREWVASLGAQRTIDHSQPLTEQLASGEVDFVFSSYTSGRTAELAEVMAPLSRLSLIDDPAEFTITDFKPKSIGVMWESMFTRSKFGTADIAVQGHILARVADLIDTGRIQPITTKVLTGLTAETIREGHRILESGGHIGKLSVVY